MKSEIQMTKSERSPKLEIRMVRGWWSYFEQRISDFFRHSGFGIQASFGFRISVFGFIPHS